MVQLVFFSILQHKINFDGSKRVLTKMSSEKKSDLLAWKLSFALLPRPSRYCLGFNLKADWHKFEYGGAIACVRSGLSHKANTQMVSPPHGFGCVLSSLWDCWMIACTVNIYTVDSYVSSRDFQDVLT